RLEGESEAVLAESAQPTRPDEAIKRFQFQSFCCLRAIQPRAGAGVCGETGRRKRRGIKADGGAAMTDRPMVRTGGLPAAK
ncbi:MAG TPA: hypothetical protein VNH84_12880, partial [Candidatus Saccharimonadales bacterium]|nr:hypothetical protein [Candidatus Saccharimonadales bacterium]